MTRYTVRVKSHCTHRVANPDGGIGSEYGPGSILRVTADELMAFADKFDELPEPNEDRPEVGTPVFDVDAETPEEVPAGVDATLAAFELAEEFGVDLADVEGTGVDGRVTKGDVQRYLNALEAES